MALLRVRRRRRRTRPLQEAEAYARCHGDRGNDVKLVRLPPRRPRYLSICAPAKVGSVRDAEQRSELLKDALKKPPTD
jgi:hypothetical protein